MNKMLPVVILALILFTIASCSSRGAEKESVDLEKYRAPVGLAELIEETEMEYILVDVRTPEEYAEGFIPTAVNIPVSEIEAAPPEVPKDSLVVVYCRSGSRSARAAGILRDLGYLKLVDFGGISRWEGERHTVRE